MPPSHFTVVSDMCPCKQLAAQYGSLDVPHLDLADVKNLPPGVRTSWVNRQHLLADLLADPSWRRVPICPYVTIMHSCVVQDYPGNLPF